MISIICTHPDLLEFINIKTDLNKVTKANISIRILDDFMKAVKEDKDWNLYFKRKETDEEITKTYKAKEIFEKICKTNWDYAEPGMLFWDRICTWNLLSEDEQFKYSGVNPCAEEPLPNYGSCLLGSINLSEFVKNPFTDKAEFDFNDFSKTVELSIKALNEVLLEGLPLHPLEEQRKCVNDWRQIGLGVMGIGDMLIKLGLTYGSKESINLCSVIGLVMADKSILTSALIAKENGCYPKCDIESILNSPYFIYNTMPETRKIVRKYGLANSQLLTIAPTGSLSNMLGITGGIEPIFNISYTRKTESLHGKDVFYKVYTPIVEEYMKINNIKDEKDLPEYFTTAMTLDYKQRIDMQSIWQNHIDASISSTINLSQSATLEDVKELYMYAWEKGLKGVTIYRDKCKREGILTTSDKQINDKSLQRGEWKRKAEDTIYYPKKIYTGCGKITLFIGWSDVEQEIQDFYIKRSGNGGCERSLDTTIIGMSGMIRLGGNIDNITKAFEGLGTCPSFATARAKGQKLSRGNSCGTAMLLAIKDFIKEKKEKIKTDEINEDIKTFTDKELKFIKENGEIIFAKRFNKCPQCGEQLKNVNGCITCSSCGWSKCD